MLGFNISRRRATMKGGCSTSLMQAFVNLRRGVAGKLQPPDPDFERG